MRSYYVNRMLAILLICSVSLLGYVMSVGAEDAVPTEGKVLIDSSVQIRQSNSVNYSFAEDTLVDSLTVGNDYVEIDGLKIQSYPSTGYLDHVIYTCDPDTMTGYVLRFTATATSNVSVANYNISGLDADTRYDWFVDGDREALLVSDSSGIIEYSYSAAWSTHEFILQASTDAVPTLQAQFTYTNQGFTYYFTDKSYGSIVRWTWNYGDGFGSSSQNPKHTYASSGSYSVSLTVYDAEGHSSTATGTIRIVLGPEQPFEKTDEGWALWFSDTLTLRFSAVALLAAGMFIIAAAKFGPEWPLITKSGRVIIGGIMIAVSVYWLVFKDTQLLSVLGLS